MTRKLLRRRRRRLGSSQLLCAAREFTTESARSSRSPLMHPVACCSQVKRRDSSASMTDELFRISRQNSMTSVGGEDFADIEVAQTLGPRASPTPAFVPPDGKSYPPPAQDPHLERGRPRLRPPPGRQLSRSVSRVQLKRWASDGWRKARSAGNYWLLFGIAAVSGRRRCGPTRRRAPKPPTHPEPRRCSGLTSTTSPTSTLSALSRPAEPRCCLCAPSR